MYHLRFSLPVLHLPLPKSQLESSPGIKISPMVSVISRTNPFIEICSAVIAYPGLSDRRVGRSYPGLRHKVPVPGISTYDSVRGSLAQSIQLKVCYFDIKTKDILKRIATPYLHRPINNPSPEDTTQRSQTPHAGWVNGNLIFCSFSCCNLSLATFGPSDCIS